jgi:hypothetical protein
MQALWSSPALSQIPSNKHRTFLADDDSLHGTNRFCQLCDSLVDASKKDEKFDLYLAMTKLEKFIDSVDLDLIEPSPAFESICPVLVSSIDPALPVAQIRESACYLIYSLCRHNESLARCFTDERSLSFIIANAQCGVDPIHKLSLETIGSLIEASHSLHATFLERFPVAAVCGVQNQVHDGPGRTALCKVLQEYARLPLPDVDPIIGVVASFLESSSVDGDTVTVILNLLLNICEWRSVAVFADQITMFPQFLCAIWPSGDVTVVALRLLRRAFVLHGVTFGVALSQVVGLAIDDDREEDDRFGAALTTRALVEASSAFRLEILSGGLLKGILEALVRVSMRIRFHLAMTILSVAGVCDETTLGRFLEPPGSEQSFYDVTPVLLEMENTFVFERLIETWDRLLGLGDDPVIARFFDLFPGVSIWEAFAVDDDALEAKADAFIRRWAGIEE